MADLRNYRQLMLEHFRKSSRLADIEIQPKNDDNLLDLMERIYEEFKYDRAITIDLEPRDDLILFDYFFKFTSVEDVEFEMLRIFVVRPEEKLDVLWTMYRMWLHENCSRKDIETRFPREKTGKTS